MDSTPRCVVYDGIHAITLCYLYKYAYAWGASVTELLHHITHRLVTCDLPVKREPNDPVLYIIGYANCQLVVTICASRATADELDTIYAEVQECPPRLILLSQTRLSTPMPPAARFHSNTVAAITKNACLGLAAVLWRGLLINKQHTLTDQAKRGA